jgi:phosphotransacetylase
MNVDAPDKIEEAMMNQLVDLGQNSDRSRENSGNMLELDPNAKVLKMLRERKFLDVYKEGMVHCDTDKLANMLKVIQIAQGFSTIGFFVFESAGV